jgi:hypothetical protein
MNQDEEHLRLLSIFHYVCAGLAALAASIPIVHLVMGLLMAFRPEVFGPGNNRPPAFMGWFLIAFAGAIILFGWTYAGLLAWAGRCLQRRVHYTFCLVAAGAACLFMPFGTILGVFTILVLVRPSVKTLFAVRSQPPLAA